MSTVVLSLLTVIVAIASAFVARGRICTLENKALGSLVLLVLFAVFFLLQIQIVAGAEITGLIDKLTFTGILAVGCVLLAAVFAIPAKFAATAAQTGFGTGLNSRQILESSYLKALILLCAASGAVFAVNAAVSYAFGSDGLSYHLPLALSWLQNHSLAIPHTAAWQYSMPANGEIPLLVLLAAGLERLAFLPNLVCYAILVISVYLLGRRLTSNPLAAFFGALVIATVPIIQFHATSAYIDLFGASFILAGAALFAYRGEMTNRRGISRWYVVAVAMTGLAWGIAVGTKPIFYAYGGLFAFGALIILWRERNGRNGVAFTLAALLIGAMLIPSAFWFLRALEATGNPIYPIPVRLFNWTIFKGVALDEITRGNPEQRFVPSTLAWIVYPWVEFKDYGYAFGVTSGLGAVWASFVPLGFFYAIYFSIRNTDRSQARNCAVMLLTLVVMLILWWFALRRFPRFGLPIPAFGAALAVPLFAYLLEHRATAVKSLFMVSLVTTLTLSTFVPAHKLLGIVRSSAWSRTAVFEIPDIVNRLPPGSVIWNGSWEIWNYALAGNRLSNHVIFRRCWREPDFADYIARRKIDYVVEFQPYRCGKVQSLGPRLIFEGRVGPTHTWRIWAVSPRAKAASY